MRASYPAVLLLALAAPFAGCSGLGALAPGTPSQQVQAAHGTPSGVWKNPDGSEVWEYPLGPLGTETYMVSFDPDHRVREVRQVLDEETISKLKIGMSRDEVRRMIGKPREIGFADRTNEEIWSWLYREWKVRKMELYVQFDRPTGKVKGISRFQVDPSDDRPR